MSDLRRRLARLHAEEGRRVARQFLDDPRADLGDAMRRLDTARRLLDHQAAQQRPVWLPASIGLLCLLLAALAWAVHVPRTQIGLRVVTQAATMELAAPWSWSGRAPVSGGPVRMEGWERIDVPMLGLEATSARGDAWLEVDGGAGRLVSLQAQPQTRLAMLQRSPRELDLLAQRGPLDVELTLSGPARMRLGAGELPGGEREVGAGAPETLSLRSQGEGAVPASLGLQPGADWRLRDLPVRALSFALQTPAGPGAVAFESAVVAGSVDILATGRGYELDTGERLTLRGVEGRIVEVTFGDAIGLRFEGSAGQILLGPEGYARSLAPTWLEYLYHHRPLSFFWGAVMFLWGTIWSARRILATTV